MKTKSAKKADEARRNVLIKKWESELAQLQEESSSGDDKKKKKKDKNDKKETKGKRYDTD